PDTPHTNLISHQQITSYPPTTKHITSKTTNGTKTTTMCAGSPMTTPSPITTLSMESSSGCATSVAQRVGANSTMTRLPTITSATDCRRTTRGGVVKNCPLNALNSANIATSSPGLQLTCKLIH